MTTEMTRREALERAAWLLGEPESLDYLYGAHGAADRSRNASTEASQSLMRTP
ncbi:MAG TPA: hypothetical protein VES88_13710 [Gemmatimonadaceae bacterium]|nr:hypothetical protein [Gemmatimonadaceae bacterium]